MEKKERLAVHEPTTAGGSPKEHSHGRSMSVEGYVPPCKSRISARRLSVRSSTRSRTRTLSSMPERSFPDSQADEQSDSGESTPRATKVHSVSPSPSPSHVANKIQLEQRPPYRQQLTPVKTIARSLLPVGCSLGTPRIKYSDSPYVRKFGRRYLNDATYILPSDLQEIQRQNLLTMLTTTAIGSPFNHPIDPLNPPRMVLDAGCGSGYWSSLCHDFFCCLGLPPPCFVGMDIIAEAPDLTRLGVNWKYARHNFRDLPLPFPDATFDVIFFKDMFTCVGGANAWTSVIKECRRILKPGGIIEMSLWDLHFRRLMPNLNVETTDTTNLEDEHMARESGCYLISPNSDFVPSKNKYLSDLRDWVRNITRARNGITNPLEYLAAFTSWPEMEDCQVKRVAIPLSTKVKWESPKRDSVTDGEISGKELDAVQVSMRETAALSVLQLAEALEPYLKMYSGKSESEWRAWWDGMASSLMDNNSCAGGECLEVGGWWGRKPYVQANGVD